MEDYKARTIEEYEQLTGKLSRLQNLLAKWEAGQLDFTPSCPRRLLERQQDAMRSYMDILEERAVIEGVTLPA